MEAAMGMDGTMLVELWEFTLQMFSVKASGQLSAHEKPSAENT